MNENLKAIMSELDVQGLYRTIAELRQQVAELRKELVMRKLQQDAADRAARLINQRRHDLARHKRAKALPYPDGA
jgi:tRNA U54 and U55 pseudouridine synthase Pus10